MAKISLFLGPRISYDGVVHDGSYDKTSGKNENDQRENDADDDHNWEFGKKRTRHGHRL